MRSFIIAFLFLLPIDGPLTSSGNTAPGTGANLDRAGVSDWTSPGNILSDDNATAACTGGASGSDYLVASNFNFSSIPDNAVILGITVRFAAAESSTGAETTTAQLQDAAAALFGSTKTNSVNGTGETIYTYGASNDIWGLANNTVPATISTGIIKDADFGVRFWYTTTHNMTVDYVTIAIEYSVGGGFFRMMSRAGTIKNLNINRKT